MPGKHLISKQQYDLRLTRCEEAHDIQLDVGRLHSQRLLPAFEALFDRLAGPEQLIRLGKIELNLGAISRRELFSDEFTRKLVSLLEVIIGDASDASSGKAVTQPLRVGRFELWLYFLEHGYLPAHASQPDSPAEWHRHIFETLASHESAVQGLRWLLSARPVALERLIAQYDEAFLQQIVILFTARNQDELPAAIREMGAVIVECMQTPAALSQWLTRPDFWQVVLREGALPTEIQAVGTWIARMLQGDTALRNLMQSASSISEAVPSTPIRRQVEIKLWRIVLEEAIIHGHKADTPGLLARAFRHEALRHLHLVVLKTLAEKESSWRRMAGAIRAIPEPAQRPAPKKGQTRPPEAATKPRMPSSGENIFYISNAGVILLHPFLPEFFGKLGLCQGPSFKDEWSRGMAVCLLHHLVTGELRTPEYQLVLPKLLCGMPFNAPLDHTITISAEAQVTGNHLLRAVIEHWGNFKKWKNPANASSLEALRQVFLQRGGKLERRQSGWLLQVERDTIDLLLNDLPPNLNEGLRWDIGIVKLPWMEPVLSVKWRESLPTNNLLS